MKVSSHDIKHMQIVEERDDAGNREYRVFIVTGKDGMFTGLVDYDENGYRIDYEPVAQIAKPA